MQRTSYKLSFEEVRGLMLFLRDTDWEILRDENRVQARFIYDTCMALYARLEKLLLRKLKNKKRDIPCKVSLSGLESLSISILARHPHENARINSVINKLLLETPIEVINILNPANHEKSIG